MLIRHVTIKVDGQQKALSFYTSPLSSGFPFEPERDRTYGQCRAPDRRESPWPSTQLLFHDAERIESQTAASGLFWTRVRRPHPVASWRKSSGR